MEIWKHNSARWVDCVNRRVSYIIIVGVVAVKLATKGQWNHPVVAAAVADPVATLTIIQILVVTDTMIFHVVVRSIMMGMSAMMDIATTQTVMGGRYMTLKGRSISNTTTTATTTTTQRILEGGEGAMLTMTTTTTIAEATTVVVEADGKMSTRSTMRITRVATTLTATIRHKQGMTIRTCKTNYHHYRRRMSTICRFIRDIRVLGNRRVRRCATGERGA